MTDPTNPGTDFSSPSPLQADCPFPAGVRACSSRRGGGVSDSPFHSLNLGMHVGDDADAVQKNRSLLSSSLQLPSTPMWLNQTHGNRVCVSGSPTSSKSFDAAWTDKPGRVLAVLTADCLPVVFASQDGHEIAVAHAGWRGLAAGVLQNTIQQFSAKPEQLMAWMGPAIGPRWFEVGPEVRDTFITELCDRKAVDTAFEAGESSGRVAGKWYADLYQLARIAMREAGLESVYGGGLCTYSDATNYYSYRRDGKQSGRMATLVWRS